MANKTQGSPSSLAIKSFPCFEDVYQFCAEKTKASWNNGKSCTIIFPTHAPVEQAKKRISKTCVCGASITSYDHWLADQWYLYGNGTQLASPLVRIMLLRPIVKEFLGREPSQKYLLQFAHFVEESICLKSDDLTKTELSGKQPSVFEVLNSYKLEIKKRGFVEPAQAEHYLCLQKQIFRTCSLFFVGEHNILHHRMEAIKGFSRYTETYLLGVSLEEQSKVCSHDKASELTQLYAALYSNQHNLQPAGAVHVAQAFGMHAHGELVAQLVERIIEQGARYQDIALLSCAVDEQLLLQLAKHNISFNYAATKPINLNAFGVAFLQLLRIRLEHAGIRFALTGDIFEDTCDFLLSPYSGISSKVASKIQCDWRKRAKPSANICFKELCELALSCAGSDNEIHPLQELLSEKTSLKTCLKIMLTNAQNARKQSGKNPRNQDDCAAKTAISNYLDLCEDLHITDYEQIKSLSIPFQRSFGNAIDCISILNPLQFDGQNFDHIIFGNLDADAFPMTQAKSPFESIMQKCEIASEYNHATHQRLLLLNILECSKTSFSAYRICHDSIGQEARPSALWEELLSPYRSDYDEAHNVSIEEIPQALQNRDFSTRISEAYVFEQDKQKLLRTEVVQRGKLQRAESLNILFPQNSLGEKFSPTALEKLHQCPYQWLVNNRIVARSIDKECDVMVLGNFAHGILEEFYKQWLERKEGRVTENNVCDALSLLKTVCSEQIEQQSKSGDLVTLSRLDELKIEKVCSQVQELIKRDAVFLPGFEPRFLELELFEKKDGSPYAYAGVEVGGKIDRVDVDKDGRAIIIDYKMSSLASGYSLKFDCELPYHIQTDIYACLLQQYFQDQGLPYQVVASVYRSYTKTALAGTSRANIDFGPQEKLSCSASLPNEKNPKSYDTHLSAVENHIAECLDQVSQVVLTPDPIGCICSFCSAVDYCSQRKISW